MPGERPGDRSQRRPGDQVGAHGVPDHDQRGGTVDQHRDEVRRGRCGHGRQQPADDHQGQRADDQTIGPERRPRHRADAGQVHGDLLGLAQQDPGRRLGEHGQHGAERSRSRSSPAAEVAHRGSRRRRRPGGPAGHRRTRPAARSTGTLPVAAARDHDHDGRGGQRRAQDAREQGRVGDEQQDRPARASTLPRSAIIRSTILDRFEPTVADQPATLNAPGAGGSMADTLTADGPASSAHAPVTAPRHAGGPDESSSVMVLRSPAPPGVQRRRSPRDQQKLCGDTPTEGDHDAVRGDVPLSSGSRSTRTDHDEKSRPDGRSLPDHPAAGARRNGRGLRGGRHPHGSTGRREASPRAPRE